jgi:pectate lyase C
VSLEFLGIHRSRRRWNGDCVGEEGMTYRRRSWWLLAGLVVTGCTADVTGTPAGDRAADAGGNGAPDAAAAEPDAAGGPDGGPVDEGEVREGGVVAETVVVTAGEVFNGGGNRFTAGPALGDGSQDEDQLPVFRLEDGAVLRNVVLGAPAADGVHTFGDVVLENVVWEDIGEDAMTIKESGRVEIRGGSATNGDDKVFQVNAPSTLVVTDFTASNAGKFVRQNGDTTFTVDLIIDGCDISNMAESIARTDSPTTTVTMTNTRYSAIGDALFIGFAAGNVTESGNTEY